MKLAVCLFLCVTINHCLSAKKPETEAPAPTVDTTTTEPPNLFDWLLDLFFRAQEEMASAAEPNNGSTGTQRSHYRAARQVVLSPADMLLLRQRQQQQQNQAVALAQLNQQLWRQKQEEEDDDTSEEDDDIDSEEFWDTAPVNRPQNYGFHPMMNGFSQRLGQVDDDAAKTTKPEEVARQETTEETTAATDTTPTDTTETTSPMETTETTSPTETTETTSPTETTETTSPTETTETTSPTETTQTTSPTETTETTSSTDTTGSTSPTDTTQTTTPTETTETTSPTETTETTETAETTETTEPTETTATTTTTEATTTTESTTSTTTTTRRPHRRPPYNATIKCRCGVQTKRFVQFGPTKVETNLQPWIVSINTTRRHLCTGSIINSRYVLTAASCVVGVQASSLRIEAAVTTPSKSRIFTGQQISIHPLYNSVTKSNNLALIEVKQQIITSKFVRYICLPIGEGHRDSPGTLVTLLENYRKRSLTLLQEEVQPIWRCRNLPQVNVKYKVPPGTFCSAPPRTACGGDIGGAFIHPGRGYSFSIKGVVSTTAGCKEKKKLAVYTLVSRYIYWILYSSQAGSYCQSPDYREELLHLREDQPIYDS